MKKIKIVSFILLSMLMTTVGFSQNYPSEYGNSSDDKYYEPDAYDQSDNDRYSYEEFYDELSPYGSWVEYPQYGYVWIPRVSNDFHPYATEGHWVMTNYGWTWVSDYHWGWAAFHYGRWAYEPRFGWMWIPGRKWGPAWVAWRESDDYFGWAPLGPFGRISINVSCPYDHYRFVPRRYFTHRNVYNYYSDRRNNVTIINHTTYINETHIVNNNKYYYGPRKDYVERAVGQPIRVAKVSDRSKPDADFVDNDNVKVYRPRFDNKPTDGRRSAPKKVVNAADLQAVPSDRRLTPSVKQNTEGGQSRPQGKQPRRDETMQQPNGTRQPIPNNEQRPQRQPRREDATPGQPSTTRQPMPSNEQRPQRQPRNENATQGQPSTTGQPMPSNEQRPQRQPRREDATPGQPSTTRQQVPSNEQRPQRQPRQDESIRQKPSNTQPRVEQPRNEKASPQPIKEKKVEPQGKPKRDSHN